MNNRKLITTGACLVAAISGFFLSGGFSSETRNATGSPTAGSMSRNDPDPRAGRSSGGNFNESRRREIQRSPEQLAKLKAELQRKFSESPSAMHDWVLRGETAAILASLTAEELGTFVTELFDPLGSDGVSWHTALCREILRVWSDKDPVGASLAAAPWSLRGEAFQHWLRRDPDAATAWINSSGFPPEREKRALELQSEFLGHLASTDLPAAHASLAGLAPKARERALLDWSQKLAHDPGKRAELIALLSSGTDPALADMCFRAMVSELATKSPSEASDFVENLDFSEDRKHALSEVVLGQWAKQAPQEAFGAWAELGEQEAPAPLLRAMDVWSMNSPGAEQALDWVMNLQPGNAWEQFKEHLLTRMARAGRLEQAAILGMSLADPVERLRHLKRINQRLQESSPKRAEDWLRSLSPEDQAAMRTPLD